MYRGLLGPYFSILLSRELCLRLLGFGEVEAYGRGLKQLRFRVHRMRQTEARPAGEAALWPTPSQT